LARTLACLSLLLALTWTIPAASVPDAHLEPELPLAVPSAHIRPLRDSVDPAMQKRLEARLKSDKTWARLIANGKMAVGLVDLSDPERIRFARVNGDRMMYAASLPKLAILLAAADGLERGTLQESPQVLDDMQQMIRVSDNGAATRMIDRIGFDSIAAVLQNPDYELYDPEHGGGLWVGKAYAKRGKRYPDPLMGISHGASVTQVCRFYYLLAMGRLVSRERSVQMLEMLRDPQLHHKFVNTYDRLAPGAVLYRKSGTWKTYHADSVLVWGPVWRRYIVVGLIDDRNGEQILRNLVPAVESVLESRPPEAR